MTISCTKCKKPAVTFIRYNGTHLCENHFIQYFERRVKKDIKRQGKTEDSCKIGIALSGGKDSTVAIHLIHNIFSIRKKIELIAISIDEGISKYRNESIKIAEKNCNKLGIEQHIVSFKNVFNTTIDDISRKNDILAECTYCGVFRRLCLNKESKKLGIDKLVTGHNLDDLTQSILMNITNGDIQKLARLGPHKKIQPGLVPRMFPVRVIPEKEVALYAILKQISYHDDRCPYSINAYRGVFREIIDDLEDRNPGTKHSILKSYDSIKDLLSDKFSPIRLNNCKQCGEPTSQNICKTCKLIQKIN